MNARVALATAATLAAVAFPAPAYAADTDPRNCSRGEYARVHNGMTRTRLTALMDSPGRLYGERDSGAYHFRSWLWGRGKHNNWCAVDTVRIGTSRARVVSKMWIAWAE